MNTKSSRFLSRIIAGLAVAALGLLLPACNKKAPEPEKVALTTDDQKVSYGIAYSIAKDVSGQTNFKLEQAAFKAGMNDGLAGTPTKIPEAELQAAFQTIQQRAAATAAAEAGKRLAAETDFLAKNKARPGVKVTASGLQYEVLKKGAGGPKAKATSTISVHYHGTFLDGSVFDSSVNRGTPAEFTLGGGVIPAWTEAVQLMSVGDKFKLYVPSAIGYGPRGRPGIPPNAMLIFEVELLAIK